MILIYRQCFELQITDASEKMEILIEYLIVALYLLILTTKKALTKNHYHNKAFREKVIRWLAWNPYIVYIIPQFMNNVLN